MSPETYNLIDTAIKIGLGALISGVSTYFITKFNYQNSRRAEAERRKSDLVERSSEQIEVFVNSFFHYWAFIIEYTRCNERGAEQSDDIESRLKLASQELFESFKILSSAESKMLLLGFENAQSLTRNMGEYIVQFRRQAYFGNKKLNESWLVEQRSVVLDKRKSVFIALREQYKK